MGYVSVLADGIRRAARKPVRARGAGSREAVGANKTRGKYPCTAVYSHRGCCCCWPRARRIRP
ncbi:hypothetical protein EMIT0111MI5_20447 [Burkholderia sp. IT-111MI5]